MQQLYSCPNCKSPVNFGDKFCATCGIYLNWPAQQHMPPPYQQPPPPYQQPPTGYRYQQPGWGQPPPQSWGYYPGQQQQNFYGYGPGGPQKKGSSAGFMLLIVLVIIMMVVGAFGILTGGTFDIGKLDFIPSSSSTAGVTQPDGSSEGTESTPAAPEKIEITATALVEAYTADSAAAEATYKGNICVITGVVAGLSSMEPYYVLLTSTGSPDEIGAKCMFSQTYLSTIQGLESGQTVTIEGTVGDYSTDILVNDCKFVN